MGVFDGNRFHSSNQEWETPDEIFMPLNEEFGFTCDAAASDMNHKCPRYFTKENDALTKSWAGEICWLNPPYRQVGLWIKKAYQESLVGAMVVCLVQARTNTNWWHDYAMKGEIRFIRGRPRFKGCKYGLPQPLAIVIFAPNKQKDEEKMSMPMMQTSNQRTEKLKKQLISMFTPPEIIHIGDEPIPKESIEIIIYKILQICKESGLKFVPDNWETINLEIKGKGELARRHDWYGQGVYDGTIDTFVAINSQIKEITLEH